MSYYLIQARVFTGRSDGWRRSRDVPTFCLPKNILGIVSEEHAIKVALDILGVDDPEHASVSAVDLEGLED